MIKANELRIGNKVTERNNHRIYEVKNILLNSVVVKYWSCGETEEIPCNRLIPIPLTPEILEQCGFDVDVWSRISIGEDFKMAVGRTSSEDGLPYHIGLEQRKGDGNGFTIIEAAEIQKQENIDDDEVFLLKRSETVFLKSIKYLHQLQNLYFALTGEELNVNLNVEPVIG